MMSIGDSGTMLLFLCIIIVLILLIVIIRVFFSKRESFTSVGCRNNPPNFKHGYKNIPNMYKVAPLKGVPLGSNLRMVALGKGSCASNVNGVNLPLDSNRYGNLFPDGIQSYSYCVKGAPNFFDTP